MTEIEVKNLNKNIKNKVILNNISMNFKSGKIYGLKGKNGSGKTMLMRVIAGLMFPTSGTVMIDGKELHKDIDFPNSIGVLIETPSFIPNYSGYDNLLMLSLLGGKVTKKDIDVALKRVDLFDEKDKIYRKYSLGMKQKLGIANAIIGEPDIIILDEPINALDEESVEKIKNTLIELKKKNKLIIIACHDKEELYYLSDYIFELKDGSCIGEFGVEEQ